MIKFRGNTSQSANRDLLKSSSYQGRQAGIMWKSSSSGPDLRGQVKRQMTEGSRGLSIFNGLKTLPMSPETLMAEINNAISNLEYARATAFLDSLSDSLLDNNKSSDGAYKAD
ncbi:uncharacterized protein LOC107420894 [Ziziphus jujuba]|uniref:Uncharacterized protein LOC107420894 n=1 Tax=Ziziphus jujuba TaxID=326968 RepID=A0ABM4A9I7_ZIZJJ|nr:uncharacterized protein LOC107420894 [Ziziphus jujuba]